MKVLQTISGLSAKSGGPSTCTHDLLEGLNEASPKSSPQRKDFGTSPDSVFEGRGVVIHAIGDKECQVDLLTFDSPDNLGKGEGWLHELENDCFSPFGISSNFRKALENSDYDIYHCNALWMYCNHITCKKARKKNKPYILSPHGMLYPTALAIKPWKKWPALKLWFNKDIHSATCIHATCKQEAEHCRAFGYKGPIAVIPNPVVLPEYAQLATSKPLINGRKQIGFLGRLHPIKKVENVIYALGYLNEEERNKLSFQIMGKYDDQYEQWLKEETKRLGLEDCVEFVGFVSGEDKYRRLQNLWALMVPSAQENFGMIVPEALICGTPVYASLGTPWSELNGIPSTSMTHDPIAMTHRCGWWKDNSPETIANVIREIIDMDESQCLAMGANGRKLIEEKYEQHSVASMMQRLYKWVANGGEKPEFVYFD